MLRVLVVMLRSAGLLLLLTGKYRRPSFVGMKRLRQTTSRCLVGRVSTSAARAVRVLRRGRR